MAKEFPLLPLALLGGAGLLLFRATRRQTRAHIVPISELPETAAAAGGVLSQIASAAVNAVRGTPVTTPTTQIPSQSQTPPPFSVWPLKVLVPESDVREDTREWAQSHDLADSAKVTDFYRYAMGQAQASGVRLDYYWAWMTDELARAGAPARTLTMAQHLASSMGPRTA